MISPYLTQTRFKRELPSFDTTTLNRFSVMLVEDVTKIGALLLFCSITPCLSIMCSRSVCVPFYYEIKLMDGWISIARDVSCR